MFLQLVQKFLQNITYPKQSNSITEKFDKSSVIYNFSLKNEEIIPLQVYFKVTSRYTEWRP